MISLCSQWWRGECDSICTYIPQLQILSEEMNKIRHSDIFFENLLALWGTFTVKTYTNAKFTTTALRDDLSVENAWPSVLEDRVVSHSTLNFTKRERKLPSCICFTRLYFCMHIVMYFFLVFVYSLFPIQRFENLCHQWRFFWSFFPSLWPWASNPTSFRLGIFLFIFF